MTSLVSLTNAELLALTPLARAAERKGTADVIAYLAEIDRRRLYLQEACSSLHAFCVERLGYSEEEATKRMKVARLAQRFPQVLAELESGAIHLTGLYLLCSHLTSENADALLSEARGKTRRELEAILARWFPRPDVLATITPLAAAELPLPTSIPVTTETTIPGTSSTGSARFRLEPLSASSYRVEFTASIDLHDKVERARKLLAHAIPSGDLAALFERAMDELLRAETKRRFGADKPRKRRAPTPGSRHIPVEVARVVWKRDAHQCTFVDDQGRRCSETRFLTVEHEDPFARGGPPTVENLCLLCGPHNQDAARRVFGSAFVEEKRAEADVYAKIQSALERLGFDKKRARAALEVLRQRGAEPEPEPLLRQALASLVG